MRQLRLFEDDWDLTDEQKRAAHVYLANAGDRTAAILAVRPALKPASARQLGVDWFGANPPTEKNPGNPELLDYVRARQLQVRIRERLEESELVAMGRRNYLHAVGDAPMRKSLVTRSESGKVTVDDVEVHEPSLSAANAAVELLRKIGGFGKDLEQSGGALVFELHLAGKTAADQQAGANG